MTFKNTLESKKNPLLQIKLPKTTQNSTHQKLNYAL